MTSENLEVGNGRRWSSTSTRLASRRLPRRAPGSRIAPVKVVGGLRRDLANQVDLRVHRDVAGPFARSGDQGRAARRRTCAWTRGGDLSAQQIQAGPRHQPRQTARVMTAPPAPYGLIQTHARVDYVLASPASSPASPRAAGLGPAHRRPRASSASSTTAGTERAAPSPTRPQLVVQCMWDYTGDFLDWTIRYQCGFSFKQRIKLCYRHSLNLWDDQQASRSTSGRTSSVRFGRAQVAD